jgi:starch-binding outer membrane protein, SusD/RagB family
MNSDFRKDIAVQRSRRGAGTAALTLLAALGLSACEVTNPGPVNDEFLTLEAAQQGFVNGSKERLTRAVGWLAYSTALISREIFPGGQTGSYGHSVQHQAGSHAWSSSGPNSEYNNAQQARWVGEEAVRRFKEVGNVPPARLAEAYLWAGYANRVLGENWCEAVIDGGELQPGKTYFERAEKHFSDALALNPPANTRLAALAGRAQARMWLNNWSGAVADAGQVPDSYNFMLEMDISAGNTAQRNHLVFASSSSPYRSFSVRFTFFDAYYNDTGDPRVPWGRYALATDTLCVGSLQGLGRVPCTRQLKYRTENDDIRLAGGREMRLIEAEALLRDGNWQGAMTKINAVRASITSEKTGQPLQPWTATNLNEAWTMLKRERGIELWLEARRMGDQRRWEPIIGETNTPGSADVPNFEARSSLFVSNPRGRELNDGEIQPRVLCYNISNTERNTNPNIPDVAG